MSGQCYRHTPAPESLKAAAGCLPGWSQTSRRSGGRSRAGGQAGILPVLLLSKLPTPTSTSLPLLPPPV